MKLKLTISNVSDKKNLFVLLLLLLTFYCSAYSVSAQRRDHLTEMEADIVREAQEIDRRMEVFVKAIDRRFLVLNNDTSQAKQVAKDIDLWGELPTGTRLQLLTDIEKLLDEAISKIDDVAERDMKSDIFPVAVHVLADGANRFLPQLKLQMDKAADDKEKGAILGSIDFCNQIIEASAKIQKTTRKDLKKKQKT